jgi:glyoxylase-like metal-dependent hydrolase (beta-lactamase superfamily II)
MKLLTNFKLNDKTYLVDIGMYNMTGIGAAYLLKAGKTCLIDGGTREGSENMIMILKSIDSFPPDLIILTHSHFDHTQAVPLMRKHARKQGKEIEVLACHKALPNLENQSFNKIFNPKMEFLNIIDVNPLKDGDKIDLDGISLNISEVPGHISDHIAVFDETNKVLFPGDSLGVQFTSEAPYPNFMPPFWNKDSYYNSMKKMERIGFQSIALAHYGCLEGREAQEYIRNLRRESENWWTILEHAEKDGNLENIQLLVDTIFKETSLNKEMFDDVLFSEFVEWTTIGYKKYRESME